MLFPVFVLLNLQTVKLSSGSYHCVVLFDRHLPFKNLTTLFHITEKYVGLNEMFAYLNCKLLENIFMHHYNTLSK